MDPDAGTIGRGLIHFRWANDNWQWQPTPLYIAVPYWTVPAVFGALPAALALLRRRRRTAAPNVCRRCLYDLRATPDQPPIIPPREQLYLFMM